MSRGPRRERRRRRADARGRQEHRAEARGRPDRHADKRGDASGARAPASRRRWRGPLAAAGVVVLLALALVLHDRMVPRRPRAPAPAPADTLDARSAYLEGARLFQAGRADLALPHFRRVGALLREPPREYHLQIAHVLARAALQTRADAPQPASRSSVERVALVREALAHLDQAERLSVAPRDVAEVRGERANLLRVWGFPWDALLALRAAAAMDASWRNVGQAADLFAYRLHHPEVQVPGLDSMVILRDEP